MDTTKSIVSSARHFFSGTILSRFSGLARDISMAYAFGVNEAVAAFLLAMRFAHLLRRLLGEGALQMAFIPHFEELRAKNPLSAMQFFRDLSLGLCLMLLGIVIISMTVLGGFLAYGHLSEGNAHVVKLTFLMMPSLFFICLFGLNASLLQCEKHYFITGIAPIAFNLTWIAGVFFSMGFPAMEAMEKLSFFIIAACACQWIITIPATYRFLKDHFRSLISGSKVNIFGLKPLIAPFSLAILGVAAVQINSASDGIFARFADSQGPAYLWYAIRIEQLPLALFGIALSGALLPPLSRAIKSGAIDQFCSLYRFAVHRTYGFMIPITAAIFVLGDAAINLVYGRGDFDSAAVRETTLCLWSYGIGLVPSALVLMTAPAFYAQNLYRTPTFASILSIVFSTGLNALLVICLSYGAVSIAIATSAAAFVNSEILMRQLKQNFPAIHSDKKEILKICLLSALAGSAALLAEYIIWGHWHMLEEAALPRQFNEQLSYLCVKTAAFGATLYASAWSSRCQPVLATLKL